MRRAKPACGPADSNGSTQGNLGICVGLLRLRNPSLTPIADRVRLPVAGRAPSRPILYAFSRLPGRRLHSADQALCGQRVGRL